MDKREYLLKIFEEFDTLVFRHFLKEYNYTDKSDEFKIGIKEVLKEMYQSISHIDIKLIKQLTLNKANCFSFLYELKREEIFVFFGALMETHLFIEFRNNFENTNYLTTRKKESLLNKINDLQSFLSDEEINRIENQIKSDGNKVTERMILENFLIKFCQIKKEYTNKQYPTQKAVSIVNKIIKDYFNYDNTTFSRAQILNEQNLTFSSPLGKVPVYLKNVE